MPRGNARTGASRLPGRLPPGHIFTPAINYSLRRTELVGVGRDRYEQHDRFT
jgi:hypothetical protein